MLGRRDAAVTAHVTFGAFTRVLRLKGLKSGFAERGKYIR
jgi:hypothetical protein